MFKINELMDSFYYVDTYNDISYVYNSKNSSILIENIENNYMMYINMNHLLQVIKVFLAKIIIIYKICFSKERILEELKNYFQIFENV